jgi:rod shape-determining protein MreC
MRYLFAFLWKHNFFFLFLLLEVTAFLLIANDNYYQSSSILNSTNRITGSIYTTSNNISEYFHLRKVNKKLAEENARLHSLSLNAFLKTDTNNFFVKDTFYRQRYEYISAKVISNSTSKRNNYIMLNKGRNFNIEKDMAVISAGGVVGIVKEVSQNFCSVMSVLHKKTKISAKIKKNNQLGTIVWNGQNATIGSLTEIPIHVRLVKGDTVITSGYSLLFPEGVMIGTIKNFYVAKGDNFYTVDVKFSTDFNAIGYVEIVKNLMREEQQQLEDKSIDKKDE